MQVPLDCMMTASATDTDLLLRRSADDRRSVHQAQHGQKGSNCLPELRLSCSHRVPGNLQATSQSHQQFTLVSSTTAIGGNQKWLYVW